MTGIPVRHTQFASWIDNDAWMETMMSSRWNTIVKEEDAYVKKSVTNHAVQKYIQPFESIYKSAKEKMSHITPFMCGPARVEWNNVFFKTWNILGSDKKHVARDITSDGTYVWVTEDIGDGAESFELQCWSITSKQPIWKKYPVGPDVAFLQGNLYYLGVKNRLIYDEVWQCDAYTGKKEKCIYHEKSKNVNLSLEKHSEGHLKIIRDNSQDIHVLEILSSGELLNRGSVKYKIPKSWILPLIKSYGVEFVWQKQGLFLIRQFGKVMLWKCGADKPPKKLLELVAGQIVLDPFAVWSGSIPTLVCVIRPDSGTTYYIYDGSSLTATTPIIPTGLKTERFDAVSKDGTVVYGILTYNTHIDPTKLLMIGYGAYGMPTNVGSVLSRWAPLLQCGWAIGHTFLRGGGDHTEEWAKAGRRQGRVRTIEDFIALVESAQVFLQIPASHTAIYGRSAGGLLVGNALANYPNGSLMSAVYTEVPYVDELRTTTNTELPLTELEYNEFGSPAIRLEDFIGVGLLSPADSASVINASKVFVLARTAMNDSQVFTYESVKWIRRLRKTPGENDAPKLCIIEKDQGHFTPPDISIVQWSLDCAILDAWMEKKLTSTS